MILNFWERCGQNGDSIRFSKKNLYLGGFSRIANVVYTTFIEK
jgi:hypothetical protein